MLVDIHKLEKGNSKQISISELLEIPEDYGVLNNSASVNVKGSISNEGNIFLFNGNLKSKLSFSCSKCLAPVDILLDFDFSEKFSENQDLENEIIGFSGKIINLQPSVYEQLCLSIPMRVVCTENCKGLCPVCGKDLNKGNCHCNEEYINPKFEVLKSLFKDEEV